MKKLYFFSKTKLQFIEVRNFKAKFIAGLSVFAILFSAILFSLYFFALSYYGSSTSYSSLKEENKVLKTKLSEVTVLYDKLNNELENLYKVNDDLRILANLPPVSEDERKVGVGGGYFDNSLDFLKNTSDLELKNALDFVDEVSRKVSFEKNLYAEIESKLKENQMLSEAIPAILPCSGNIADHGFGLRFHPILKVRKMHEGIDIITDVGTKVFSSGKGKVDFVGRKGGYGLCIEVDHGFGYRTIYAHLSSTSVKEGQKILRGDLIAKTGNTGLSSGPHLHYEVHHNGVKKDPSEFFFDDMGFFEIKNNKLASTKK